MNLVLARLEGASIRLSPELALPLPAERAGRYAGRSGSEVVLGLRPEHLVWAPEDGIEATAQVVEPLGSDTLVFASLAGHEVVCRVPPKTVREPGERLRLRPDLASMHLFDPATEKAL
jgi:multiple sugar transport system ATP-binding protein